MAYFEVNKKPRLTFPTLTGSIVTFNAQYALPLKSHKIALTATQSGSGTPSPDNERPINGYSAINIGSDNKYAKFITWNQLYTHATIPNDSVIKNVTTYTINGITWEKNDDNSFTVYTEPTGATADSAVKIASGLAEIGTAVYSNYHIIGATGISGKARIYYSNRNIENADYGCFNPLGSGFNMWLGVRAGKIITEPIKVYPQIYNLSLMFGVAKAQEIYNSGQGATYFRGLFPLNHYEYNVGGTSTVSAVNGSTNSFFSISIGSTVYGGEYDARTGVLTVTHKGIKLVDAPKNAWQVGTKSVCYRVSLTDISTTVSSGSTHGAISNMADEYPAYFGALRPNEVDFNGFAISTGGVNLALYDTDLTLTEADFLTKYADIMFVYPLATPQTIQLPPCPIDTLEGVNNIFADTGDTTLQYPKFG